MPGIEEVVVRLLRASLPNTIKVGTWVENIDHRSFPLVNVRRLGGTSVRPDWLDLPVVEITSYRKEGLVETRDLFLDCRELLWRAVQLQTTTERGYLHSFKDVMGGTVFDAPYGEAWRVQGLIQLGLRPPRS